MELTQLIYFVSVAKTENMVMSAAQLHISQPALSMSIKRLEDELGIKLFDRRNKSITLNEYGHAYLRYVEAGLKQIENGREAMAAIAADREKRIKIVAPAYYIYGRFMDQVNAAFPDIVIESRRVNSWNIKDALLDGEIDICLSSMPIESSELESVFLIRWSRCALVSEKHRLAKRKQISFSELKDENFVAYTTDSIPRYDLDELCRKKNFSPRIICESGSLYEQLEVVRRQNCVKVTSEETARNVNISGLKTIPIADEDTFIDLYMLNKKGDESRPHLAELRDFIAEYFRNIRAETEK